MQLENYFVNEWTRDILCAASQKLLHCALHDTVVFVICFVTYLPENYT